MPQLGRRHAARRCYAGIGLLAGLRPIGAAAAAAAVDDAAILLQVGSAVAGEFEVSRASVPAAPRPRSSPLSPQRFVFEQFDTDGSGGFNRTELARFLRSRMRTVEDEGLERLWSEADLDGNSEIDMDELLDCVVNPANCFPTAQSSAVSVLNGGVAEAAASLSEEGAQRSGWRHGRRSRQQSWARAAEQAQRRMALIDDGGQQLTTEQLANMSRAGRNLMQLHLMPDKGLNTTAEAVCLDGSPSGFYFAPAIDQKRAGRWIIFIEGGSWCSTVAECSARSQTRLGSSRSWSNLTSRGGIMSDNCEANPHFCGYNRVVVNYCDGASLTGDRDEPISSKTGLLYFRGKRILDAILDTLLEKHGLAGAEQVLFTGCSAGGLSTLVHADRVNQRLSVAAPNLTKFRAVPLSGFFLEHSTVENQVAYAKFLYNTVALANSTPNLNRKCLAHMSMGKKWKCVLPENSFAFTDTPVFMVNSALDWWSGMCIFFADSVSKKVAVAPDGACGNSNKKAHYQCANNVERCTPFEMFAVNQWIRDFSRSFASSPSSSKAGNGAFFHSCHSHCEALDDKAWPKIRIGNTSMHQAVLRWWRSDGAPTQDHFYEPCEYGQGGPDGQNWPYQCNPTCVDVH